MEILHTLFSDTTTITMILASFFTSAITAAMGIGGGVVLMAIMAVFLPVSALVPVHGIVQMASNADARGFSGASLFGQC